MQFWMPAANGTIRRRTMQPPRIWTRASARISRSSEKQPRLSWIAGAFLFSEADHQSFWVDQQVPQIQVRLDPRVDAIVAWDNLGAPSTTGGCGWVTDGPAAHNPTRSREENPFRSVATPEVISLLNTENLHRARHPSHSSRRRIK